jgi:hypothetical protein
VIVRSSLTLFVQVDNYGFHIFFYFFYYIMVSYTIIDKIINMIIILLKRINAINS